MSTTLIENLKKKGNQKVLKQFHGNIKVCKFMLFYGFFFKCLLRNNDLDSLRSFLLDPHSYVLH